MRIFVTGISGYAGYYAAMRLAAVGHRVVGLVRHRSSRTARLEIQEVRLVEGDLASPETYKSELDRCDVVIHTMLDKKRPKESDRALFKAVERAAATKERMRFVYTTGCSIFGKVSAPVIDEETEPNPSHPLAFRRDLEKEALALERVDAVVVRPGFMFGYDGYNSVSAEWFEMAEAEDLVLRGDRERGWSWIHVADLAEAYKLIVESPASQISGQIFNLADDLQPKCVDVMRACAKASGHECEIRFEGPKQGENISTWFNQNEYITSAKAHRLLGWKPRRRGIVEEAETAFRAWKAAAAEFGEVDTRDAAKAMFVGRKA